MSPALLSEFESLQLKAARVLGEILDTCERDTTRASAALGILRFTERLFRKIERAPSASSGASAIEPAPTATSPAPAPVHPPVHPGFPDPASPLSDTEIAELLEYFPHVDPARLRPHRLAGMWRGHLIQARYSNAELLAEQRRDNEARARAKAAREAAESADQPAGP